MSNLRNLALTICLSAALFLIDHQRVEAQTVQAPAEDVRKLVEDMKLNAAIAAMLPDLKQQMSRLLRQMVPNDRPGHIEEVEIATGKAFDQLPSEFVDEIVPLYRRHLSKKEIAAYIEFYATPEGRSIADKTPLITEKSQKIAGALIEKLMAHAIESATKQFRARGYKL